MAITRGQINGNPDTMVDFINAHTLENGIIADIVENSGQRHLRIRGDYNGSPAVICQCNNVGTGNNQRIAGNFFMMGGGTIDYGAPYLPTVGYATSNGLLFPIAIDDNKCSCFLVSKTNNNYYGSACQYFQLSTAAYQRGCAQALGDKPFETGEATQDSTCAFPPHPGSSSWTNAAWRRDQIQLIPIPTRGNGVISYFPHAFWIPWSSTRDYGVVQIDDKKYVMSSYMALEE